MKAILRDRIFIEVEPIIQAYIEKQLTYTIPVRVSASEVRNIRLFDFKRVNSKTLSIPIGRIDLIPESHDIIDKRIYNMVDFHLREDIHLRPSQQEIYDAVDDNCIVNATCSFGKTFTGLALAEKLGQKTIVIVHTLKLMDQWIKEIDKVLGTTPGIIGRGIFDIEPDIVIATNKSVINKGTAELYNTFGTVIVDECLDYETRLDTLEEGQIRIGKIVNSKLPYHVKSWNGKSFEYKKITNWFKNTHKDYMIKFYTTNGILKCTLNHSLYDMHGSKKAAEHFYEGDYIMAAKTHKSLNLIKSNLDILLGCIIGDGSLSKDNQGIRIRITNGIKQKNYLDYKKNILKTIVRANTVEGKSGYCDNSIYSFSTLSFIDLNNWFEELYGEHTSKSIISENISKLLSIESWSLIYQDDGSISNGQIRFHVYMDEDNLNILKQSLVSLFGINPGIYTNKGFKMLGLKSEDSKIFIRKIAHLIHPDLEYKKGGYCKDISFEAIQPIIGFEKYTLVKIKDIDFEAATGNNRFNVTVEDNHNYLANGKLVANCHHIPAATFNSVVDKFRARYKIGLTATLKRKDLKQFLITNYLSDTNIYKPGKENSLQPKVVAIDTDILLPNANSWQDRVTKLTDDTAYIGLVYEVANNMAAEGHKVLVACNRVGFLHKLNDITDNSDLIIGGSEDTDEVIEKVYSGKTTIIYGTTQVVSEGLSINPLSCLILGTPIASDITLEQLAGRIIRKFEGKLQPIIIDLVLKGQTGKNQYRERKKHYKEMGYEIDEISLL